MFLGLLRIWIYFYFVYADSVTASLDFEIYRDGKALILSQLEAVSIYNLQMHDRLTRFPLNLNNETILKWHAEEVVEIYRDGKLLTPLQFEKQYQEWILQMHDIYDQEIDCGEDQPLLIVGPSNKKQLGISSDGKLIKEDRM